MRSGRRCRGGKTRLRVDSGRSGSCGGSRRRVRIVILRLVRGGGQGVICAACSRGICTRISRNALSQHLSVMENFGMIRRHHGAWRIVSTTNLHQLADRLGAIQDVNARSPATAGNAPPGAPGSTGTRARSWQKVSSMIRKSTNTGCRRRTVRRNSNASCGTPHNRQPLCTAKQQRALCPGHGRIGG